MDALRMCKQNLEVHEAGQSTSNRRESGSTVLFRHENALSVPIVPVHYVFEDGHCERMHRLTLHYEKRNISTKFRIDTIERLAVSPMIFLKFWPSKSADAM